jgi:capsid portal protein
MNPSTSTRSGAAAGQHWTVATQELTPQDNTPPHKVQAFSFGEPESVLATNMGEYLDIFASTNGRLYTPPVSRPGLAKILRANAHHGTIPRFKRNLLLRDFIASKGGSTQTLAAPRWISWCSAMRFFSAFAT